jgi:hypothetical protein
MKYEVKEINGVNYLLQGISLDLINWATKSTWFKVLYQKAHISTNDLILALVSNDLQDTILKSEECLKKFWFLYPENGPYLFLSELLEAQANCKFYPEYRDHIGHQFKVLLLGCFIFDKSDRIRKAVYSYFEPLALEQSEEEFFRIWLLTAGFHDIGYIWEGKELDPLSNGGEKWKSIRDELNKKIQYSLCKIDLLLQMGISETVEKDLNQEIKIPLELVNRPNDIQNVPFQNDICLDKILYPFATATELTYLKDEKVFSKYYQYAYDTSPIGTDLKLWDHGITSSYFLVYTWQFFQFKIKEIFKTKKPHSEIVTSWISSLFDDSKLEQNWKRIQQAVGAIALHNINLYQRKDELLPEGMNKHRYKIHLDNGNSNLPIPFLLVLCDEIQDWSRPKFRNKFTLENERILYDFDIELSFSHEHICFKFRKEGIKEKIINQLTEKLDINTLLSFDDIQKTKPLIVVDKTAMELRDKKIVKILNQHIQKDEIEGCLRLKTPEHVEGTFQCNLFENALVLVSDLKRSAISVHELSLIYSVLSDALSKAELISYIFFKQNSGSGIDLEVLNQLVECVKKLFNEILHFERLEKYNEDRVTTSEEKRIENKIENRFKGMFNLRFNTILGEAEIQNYFNSLKKISQINLTAKKRRQDLINENIGHITTFIENTSLFQKACMIIINKYTKETRQEILNVFKEFNISDYCKVFENACHKLPQNTNSQLRNWS